jgi:methyl-accepting chemotaxis protein
MARSRSLGSKIGMGYAAILVLTVAMALVSAYSLRRVVREMEQVVSLYARNGILAERLLAISEARASSARGFLVTRNPIFLERVNKGREEFDALVAQLARRTSSAEGILMMGDIERGNAGHRASVDQMIAQRRTNASLDEVARTFDDDVRPRFDALQASIVRYAAEQDRLLAQEKSAAASLATIAELVVVSMAFGSTVLAVGIAIFLTRSLKHQVGSAVQHIRGSSTELQSAATQQATGAQEQATAMNEITVTVQELLATARQIADSADRVARIAEETASGARAGDQTVQRAQEAVVTIRSQVDVIVEHMTDLGKKSQQIGGVLEIINELAEQTNILAINATIEAAGAGESGRRFAAVAEEIRKLADRVGASTKQIRGLIEEVRFAVHTTVMATESGAKAVELGTRQFGDVAFAFKQIVSLVGTTTEAAREIGLSTKQQSTAVEQVNIATTNVAQAAREAEVSSLQTVQTAADLAKLSHDLTLLVRSQPMG